MVTVKQLMKQALVQVEAGTLVHDAARLMREHRIGSLFVERRGEIVGIVTEPDIVRKVVGAS